MAIFTGIARVDMTGIFARGGRAVVTSRAGSRHSAVIECCSRPAHRRMTIVTGIGTLTVIRRFARGRCIVMATRACPVHRRVIY